jgi:hypothetical protein
MSNDGDASDDFSFVAVAFLLMPVRGTGISGERAAY